MGGREPDCQAGAYPATCAALELIRALLEARDGAILEVVELWQRLGFPVWIFRFVV